MGPVRIGNQAYSQVQHDVYGAAILAAAHVFFDARLALRSDESLFRQLEQLGERAAALFDQPDAGPWELRGAKRVHTFSSVMCWAGCDRLAKIAARIGLADRARAWRERADAMHSAICARAWNAKRKSFRRHFWRRGPGRELLLLHELNFLRADDPRFASTVQASSRSCAAGSFSFATAGRMTSASRRTPSWSAPSGISTRCPRWDARTRPARCSRAYSAAATGHGLLSEHIDPRSGELWGNFPQTYSMVRA